MRKGRLDRRGKMTEARALCLALLDSFGLIVIYAAAEGSLRCNVNAPRNALCLRVLEREQHGADDAVGTRGCLRDNEWPLQERVRCPALWLVVRGSRRRAFKGDVGCPM